MNLEVLQEIMYPIVGIIYDVRNELGPGLNESVYQEGLEMEFKLQNIPYAREKEFHPTYRGVQMETRFRLDFSCLDNVIIECKAVSKLNNDHRAQLFNYMRLTKLPIGILVNFSHKSAEIERYLYNHQTNEVISIDGTTLTNFRKQ